MNSQQATDNEKLRALYLGYTGKLPEYIEQLGGAGSNRRYFRLRGTETLIGVCGTSREENHAFLYMADHFRRKNLPVPRVYAVSDDEMAYLQEDLGKVSLFDLIEQDKQKGSLSSETREVMRKAISLLPRFQFGGGEDMDFGVCYPQAEFNRRSIAWDLNYFKYCFLKTTGIEFRESMLEDDFDQLSEYLLQIPADTFMYRDFQSRNIMVKAGESYFIDFQGGRKGAYHYDVASFLWQAKACFPPALRNEMIDAYLSALPQGLTDKETFKNQLRHFVFFRTLQVLGAYGFRGYFERKPHFIESVPFALKNMSNLLEDGFRAYPYLCKIMEEVIKASETSRLPNTANRKLLTVKVMSFSYRKGIPEDESGNGGGYVFDCRSIHNPGRYEQYKQLTGLDAPVIRFLENDGEILRFLDHADAVIDAHVERFIERGFTNLSVCFGCTGGQHRSVYSAQHVAEHLNRKYGVTVHLIHREQNIERILKPR